MDGKSYVINQTRNYILGKDNIASDKYYRGNGFPSDPLYFSFLKDNNV